MKYEGVLRKMKAELGEPIQYFMDFPSDVVNVNQLLDKTIQIRFLRYSCLNCELDKKIYRQGFCYDCFFKLPQAADWVIKPELSTAHEGIEDRDLEYEKRVQLQPHIVYLANSGHVKVGITRKTQVPTRWIDQGAHEAIPILETPNRYLAGIAEVALKDHISDKTNWRNMLRNNIENEDIFAIQKELKEFIPEKTKQYFIENPEKTEINYPVLNYPTKIKSFNFKKDLSYTGVLKGIKGQYLIFEDNTVFNIRSNSGNVVEINV